MGGSAGESTGDSTGESVGGSAGSSSGQSAGQPAGDFWCQGRFSREKSFGARQVRWTHLDPLGCRIVAKDAFSSGRRRKMHLVHALCTPCARLGHALGTPCARLAHALRTPRAREGGGGVTTNFPVDQRRCRCWPTPTPLLTGHILWVGALRPGTVGSHCLAMLPRSNTSSCGAPTILRAALHGRKGRRAACTCTGTPVASQRL